MIAGVGTSGAAQIQDKFDLKMNTGSTFGMMLERHSQLTGFPYSLCEPLTHKSILLLSQTPLFQTVTVSMKWEHLITERVLIIRMKYD